MDKSLLDEIVDIDYNESRYNNMTKQITKKQIDKILELYKKEISLRDIGTLVGLSYEGVRNIIKKYQKKYTLGRQSYSQYYQ